MNAPILQNHENTTRCFLRKKILVLTYSFDVFPWADLRQELAVKEKEKKKPGEGLDFTKGKESNKENKEPLKTEGTPVKTETTIPTSDPHTNLSTASIGTSPLHSGYGSSPLTPSARISALNIVGDLLRKVGVSEIIWSQTRRLCLLLSFINNNETKASDLHSSFSIAFKLISIPCGVPVQ